MGAVHDRRGRLWVQKKQKREAIASLFLLVWGLLCGPGLHGGAPVLLLEGLPEGAHFFIRTAHDPVAEAELLVKGQEKIHQQQAETGHEAPLVPDADDHQHKTHGEKQKIPGDEVCEQACEKQTRGETVFFHGNTSGER